jgi:hypothetical protein
VRAPSRAAGAVLEPVRALVLERHQYLVAVLRETPISAATWAMGRPAAMRSTSNIRPRTVSGELACT